MLLARVEGMVADAAVEVQEIQARRDSTALDENAAIYEFNGKCETLRALDEAQYEGVDFTDTTWIDEHRTDYHLPHKEI
jgi:hypothetical protein